MSTPVTDRTSGLAGTGDRVGHSAENPLDLLGVGFGPSNLSMAVLLEELNGDLPHRDIQAMFVEVQDHFGWHDGMMLPDTDMQISFLKDLVTPRDPTSRYSFINFLFEEGRLPEFTNLKTFNPSRREFHNYLCWVAGQVDRDVLYSTRVTGIEDNGRSYAVTTVSSDGSGEYQNVWYTRNIALGTGINAELPEGITATPRIFHNHRIIMDLERVPSYSRKSFLVVGSGQSAAEVTHFLHSEFSDAEIHSVYRRFGYTPSDDTPFANQIFDAAAVDEFYGAPAEVKRELLRKHWLTNYSAVDADLIQELFRRWYDEQVSGDRRLHYHRVSHVARVEDREDHVAAEICKEGGTDGFQIEVDAVIYATGFSPRDPRALFGGTVDCRGAFDDEDRPIVNRNYRLQLPGSDDRSGGIYLNGNVEHSHGLTSSLLSNVSIRSQDIMSDLLASRQSTPTA